VHSPLCNPSGPPRSAINNHRRRFVPVPAPRQPRRGCKSSTASANREGVLPSWLAGFGAPADVAPQFGHRDAPSELCFAPSTAGDVGAGAHSSGNGIAAPGDLRLTGPGRLHRRLYPGPVACLRRRPLAWTEYNPCSSEPSHQARPCGQASLYLRRCCRLPLAEC